MRLESRKLLEDVRQAAAQTMTVLETGEVYIKRLLASRIVIKRLPELRFKLDTSLSKAFELFKIMDKARTEDPPEADPDQKT
jgi:ribosome-binding factor A